MRLSGCEPGSVVTIARVSDSDPELLRYLAGLGLHLDVQVQVLSRQAYAGTLTVTADGAHLELGLPAAQSIWVLPASAAEPAGTTPEV